MERLENRHFPASVCRNQILNSKLSCHVVGRKHYIFDMARQKFTPLFADYIYLHFVHCSTYRIFDCKISIPSTVLRFQIS